MTELSNKKELFQKIIELIHSANDFVTKTVNSSILILYWNIGKTVQLEIVKSDRADYGKGIIESLSVQLSRDYGRGYSRSNLNRMVEFYKSFPDESIVTNLSTKLSWSHLIEIIKEKDVLKREFYITMTVNEGWSVRELNGRIQSMLFERTAISKKPEETIYNDLKQLREAKKELAERLEKMDDIPALEEIGD